MLTPKDCSFTLAPQCDARTLQVFADPAATDAQRVGDLGAGETLLVESHHLAHEFVTGRHMFPDLDTMLAERVADSARWSAYLFRNSFG